jgi:hypothetical protein
MNQTISCLNKVTQLSAEHNAKPVNFNGRLNNTLNQ